MHNMDFDEYQGLAHTTSLNTEIGGSKLLYPVLGLCGEAGEVAEKVKKQVRDGVFNRHEVAKELGDVLWYLANLANDIGYNLDEIADINIEKLTSRQDRNKIKGSGDNR